MIQKCVVVNLNLPGLLVLRLILINIDNWCMRARKVTYRKEVMELRIDFLDELTQKKKLIRFKSVILYLSVVQPWTNINTRCSLNALRWIFLIINDLSLNILQNRSRIIQRKLASCYLQLFKMFNLNHTFHLWILNDLFFVLRVLRVLLLNTVIANLWYFIDAIGIYICLILIIDFECFHWEICVERQLELAFEKGEGAGVVGENWIGDWWDWMRNVRKDDSRTWLSS